MKKYIIFAGVNGAGKTTLYQTYKEMLTLPRVNLDEIVRTLGSWKNSTDVIRSGRIAIDLIHSYMAQGISFDQETTLCGKSIIRNIKKAKETGYEIHLYYVGLSSADLAVERVRQRVAKGGHGIDEKDIRHRYIQSLENLKNVLPLCDHVKIYDNTVSFRFIAAFENGTCTDKCENIPDWCCNIIMTESYDNAQVTDGMTGHERR